MTPRVLVSPRAMSVQKSRAAAPSPSGLHQPSAAMDDKGLPNGDAIRVFVRVRPVTEQLSTAASAVRNRCLDIMDETSVRVCSVASCYVSGIEAHLCMWER
jgi:hypothetical protein